MPQRNRDGQLRAALDAAARGWHVFPLIPGSKRPAVRDWENRASTDLERIARCWHAAPYNVGVATGPSLLVVVDLDTPKGPDDVPPKDWALPGIAEGADVLALISERAEQPYPGDTFTVRTGRGGTHLYFRTPAGRQLRNTGGKLGWKVDTRAAGGYVVAAGQRRRQPPVRADPRHRTGAASRLACRCAHRSRPHRSPVLAFPQASPAAVPWDWCGRCWTRGRAKEQPPLLGCFTRLRERGRGDRRSCRRTH